MIVRKQGIENTHRDYRVRREFVLSALRWLQANNPYYADIIISEENVMSLPTDGVPSSLPTLISDDPSSDLSESENMSEEITTEVTAVEDIRDHHTERQHINSALGDNIQWPRQGTCPANEYAEIGLFSQCFPSLFPQGAADYSHICPAKPRVKEVKMGDWLKYLLCYRDGRFATHPRFRYYAWNMIQRQRVNQTGQVYVKMDENQRAMPAEELSNLLNAGNTNILNSLLHFSSGFRDTMQWKMSKRLELYDMIEFKGMPTFFITFSAADTHWPDLQYIMKRHEEGDIPENCIIDDSGRNGRVIRNPHFISAFFHKRIRLFVQEVINKDGTLSYFWVYMSGNIVEESMHMVFCG